MNIKKRRLLMVALFALFFILAPALVFYAYGWRFDFSKFQPVQVGGIFLKELPSGATVTLDNQTAKHRSKKFLTGTLIGNLLPENYLIKIEQSGYQTWGKNVNVESAFVTETQPIVLVPKKEPTQFFQKPISDFWINGSVLVYSTADGNLYLTKTGDLGSRTNLGLMFANLKERILNFPGFVPIVEVIARENPNEWSLNTEKASYLLDFKRLSLELLKERASPAEPKLTTEQLALLQSWAQDLGGPVKKISLYPDGGHLFTTIGETLYFVELADQAPLNYWLVARGVKKHNYNNGQIYFLKSDGVYYLEL